MKTLLIVVALLATLALGCGSEGGWVVGFLPELDQATGVVVLTPVKVGFSKDLAGIKDYYEDPEDIGETEIQAALSQAQETWKTVPNVFLFNERLAQALSGTVFVPLDDVSFAYPAYTYNDGEHDIISFEVKDVAGIKFDRRFHKMVAVKKPNLLLAEKVGAATVHEVFHLLGYELWENKSQVMTGLVNTLETLWSATGSQDFTADQLLGGGYSGVAKTGDRDIAVIFNNYAMAKIFADYPDETFMQQTERGQATFALWNSVGKLAFYFTGSYTASLLRGSPEASYAELRRMFLEREALSFLGEQDSERNSFPAMLKPPYELVCTADYLTVLFGSCPQQYFCGSDNRYLRPENWTEYLELIRQIVPGVLAQITADIQSGKL